MKKVVRVLKGGVSIRPFFGSSDVDLKLRYYNPLHGIHNPPEPFTLRTIRCQKRDTLRTQIYMVYHGITHRHSVCLISSCVINVPLSSYFCENYLYIWCIKCIKMSILLVCHHFKIEYLINRHTSLSVNISK